MTTLADAKAICARNSRRSAVAEAKPLTWNRVTANKIVSACGKYAIVKAMDQSGNASYDAWLSGPKTDYAQILAGHLATADEAKTLCQSHEGRS